MVETPPGWKYTNRVPNERREGLAAPGSFEQVVRLVTEDARVVETRHKPGMAHGLRDCVQPIFILELPTTGDILFNGPWGYRAQYWASAERGLAANAMLLGALKPKLLATVDSDAVPELAKIDVCASLRAASAKIWIQEILSLLVNPPRDLDVDRWVQEAEKGAELAQLGLFAPEVSRFEVKGALLDPYGNEVVPSSKIRRHHDIFHYGWS